MTRQTDRQAARHEAKHQARMVRLKVRRLAAKYLLARQTRREKDGSYEGRMSLSICMTGSRSRIGTRKLKKGQPYCRAEAQYGHVI